MSFTGSPSPLHAPVDYDCPFCFLLAGGETEVDSPRDIVLQTARATALVASVWIPDSPGHVIVIPNRHYENIYDLPASYGHAVHDVIRRVATAMRAAYECEGISVRQNNEPVGGQEIWHYHAHVIPRHAADNTQQPAPGADISPPEVRWPYAQRLRRFLPSLPVGVTAAVDHD